MKNSIAFRHAVAVLLVSLGCYALIAKWPAAALYFSFFPVLTMSRSDLTKPVPGRELFAVMIVLVTFLLLLVACRWIFPASTGSEIEQVVRHPIFVIPFGLLLFWSLYRNYKRQKARAESQPIVGATAAM